MSVFLFCTHNKNLSIKTLNVFCNLKNCGAITFVADFVMNECRKLEKSRVVGRGEVQCSS